jgi:hypothetical protein
MFRMSKVIEFPKPEQDDVPHGAGHAFCIACRHEWVAVAPVGAVDLECPQCGTMKGRYKFEFAPAPGTLVRVCNCGNEYFYLTTEGHLCANCGTYQRY